MPWHDTLGPLAMARVAVVAPETRARRVMVETADLGVFEPDPAFEDQGRSTSSVESRGGLDGPERDPWLAEEKRDPAALVAEGRTDLLRGEEDLDRRLAAAQHPGRCMVLMGWLRRADLDTLRARLAPVGGGVADLALPRGVMPPTAHGKQAKTAALRPLVSTYATVPYRDIDPTWFAAFAYMFMFGMMFGDVGDGLALVVLGIAAATLRRSRVSRLAPIAPFLIGAGVASVGFGFLYGDCFGPTGLVPTLWLRPLDEPETFLLAGLVVGSVLLSITFVLAATNRWREGGAAVALYAASGIAGALLFGGAAAVVGGLASGTSWLWRAGVAVGIGGAILVFIGLLVEAGPGPSGLAEAVIEMFDTVLRLGSNVVSFSRLAAFGLTHAVITSVVWDGTTSLWDRATLIAVGAAVLLFVVGNVAAFALGALVAAIQALRLEYYEMFSRLFTTEGRPFEPWHLPVERSEPS
jgi:V/A-type H+/Na+-transporting ATPase subunit I